MIGVPGARFSRLAAFCFESVFLPMRGLRLGGIHVLGLPPDIPPDRPVIAFANHVSNWDGFLMRELQKRLRPGWPVFNVMLEEELRRHPVLRLTGGIGMRPGSPGSVARAVRTVRALREKGGEFMLAYFPQGRIWPSFRRPLGFHPGVDLFVKAMAPATLLPVGLHLEPLGKLAPSVFLSVGRPLKVDRPARMHRLLEDLVQAQLDRIHGLLSTHGEDAPALVAALGTEVR